MSKKASPAVIGAFVIVGIGLALVMVILFGGRRVFRDTARAVVYFDGSVGGLRGGAPVKFRGVEIGSVQDVRVDMLGALKAPLEVRIRVVLELDEDKLASRGTNPLDLHDPKVIRTAVDLGLRAELEYESVVTGIRYVALDLKPGTPARLVDAREAYPEIPSVRSTVEEIPERVNQVLANLASADVANLARSLQQAVDDAHKLLSSPELTGAVAGLHDLTKNLNRTVTLISQATRDLGPAAAEWKQTATSARQLIAPEGALSTQIDATLEELKAAARSLRRLADQLSRDPGSLVRGGRP